MPLVTPKILKRTAENVFLINEVVG